MLHYLLLLRLLGKVQKQKEWVSGITSGVVMIQLLLLLWLKWAILPPYIFFLHLVQSLHHTDFHSSIVTVTLVFDVWFIYHSSPITFLTWFHSLISNIVLQDGAAVTGLAIAAASLVAVQTTGNAMYDPIGSIIVGNLLGMVCYFCWFLIHTSFSYVAHSSF